MKNKKKKEIKIKKIQIKKPNPTFPASTLQRIRFFKKAALMSALQTYSKVSTESFTFRHVKVGHLDFLGLHCAVTEGEEKLHFHLVFEARVLQELQGFFLICLSCL